MQVNLTRLIFRWVPRLFVIRLRDEKDL